MIGGSGIQDQLSIIWVINIRSSNWERIPMSLNLIYPPVWDSPRSLTPSSYLWPSGNQLFSALSPCTRRTDSSSDLWSLIWTLIFPDHLFPSYWNSCLLLPMPLLLCSLKKTVGPISLLHNSQEQRHLTVVKRFSFIDQCKSKGLILFPRKRIQ